MYQRLLFFILFLVSGCINQEGGTQSHVPVCIFESATERFEYDMLGHPVIETKLDSLYPCRLIFDTGCAGMLILDKNFAKKKWFNQSVLPDRVSEVGMEFRA